MSFYAPACDKAEEGAVEADDANQQDDDGTVARQKCPSRSLTLFPARVAAPKPWPSTCSTILVLRCDSLIIGITTSKNPGCD